MRRRRIARGLAAVTLLAVMALPGLAWAAEAIITVTPGQLPAEWQLQDSSKGTAAQNGTIFAAKFERLTDVGSIAYLNNVAVFLYPGNPYADYEKFLDGFDAERIAQSMSSMQGLDGEDGSLSFTSASWTTSNTNGKKQIWGKEAYFTEGRTETGSEQGRDVVEIAHTAFYYFPLGDMGVMVSRAATTRSGYFEQTDALWAENTAVFEGLRVEWGDGGGGDAGATVGTEGGGLPWETVPAGAGAVAAAAAAIATAAASKRGKKTKLDPDEHVGYVLELSSLRLELSTAQSAQLTATVWRVLASGDFEPATDARVDFGAPAGVGVDPASGGSPHAASVWQTGEIAPGASLVVTASASKGATTSRVELVAEGTGELVLATVPPGRRLKPTGRDAVMVAADLRMPDVTPDSVRESVRTSIAFGAPSPAEWVDTGEVRDTRTGKEMPLSLSSPDPNRQLTPPEAITVSAVALAGGRQIAGSVRIEVERPPSIDARPDTIEFSSGTGNTEEVLVWVENPGDIEWSFGAKWKEGDRALAQTALEPKGAASTLLRLTEDAAKLPDIGLPTEAATLVVTASGEGWDPLERYVKVIVTREGIFLDPIGRSADGAYHVEAKGAGEPKEIDLRVYVRDADGRIALSEELGATAEWEPAGEDSAGRTVLGFTEFSVRYDRMRPSNTPSAVYVAALRRMLPSSGEPIPATMRVFVPGYDDPKFQTTALIGFDGLDTSPYSDAWRTERDNCIEIINNFAPPDLQQRFRDLVHERGETMGAEGLYEMRRRIWSISSNALMKEHADWMDKAWTYEQIESVLDWISWCGDIAFAVASGRITGTVAGIALGSLKPMLVSAVTVYVNGGSMSDWAKEQVGFIVSVAEGQLTDPDFIQKLTGAHKAKVWAAFIAYTFIKNWYMDPEHSITRAMTQTAQMLRDQALISFLRSVTGTTPGATPKPGADGTPAPVVPPKPPVSGKGAPAPGGVKPPVSGKGAPAPGGVKPPRKPPAPGSVVHPGPNAKKQQVRGKPMKPAPEFDAPDPKTRAKKMADGIKEKITTGPDGKKRIDAGTMEKIMRDPDGARELRKNDPEAWAAYDNARKQVYGKHDSQLKSWIEENVPEAKGQKIEVRSVGTSDGVDRDYRAGIVRKDPVTGREVFVEIPKEKWAGKSHEIFAEVTGGPKDPAKHAEWSKAHQQLATDGYHAEASVDMADQGWVTDPKTGQQVRTQVTSNLILTEQGKSTLHDPDGLGKTYETKVAESYYEGGPLDGYTQANKAVHTLTEVRTGYKAQDYQLQGVPPKVLDGMQIIQKVAAGDMSPADGDAALKSAGCGDNLPAFMELLSGQFAGLKFAHK